MHPRHSVLALFDPLVSPTRDAPSPDSDKENSLSRTIRPTPLVLTRRLIDVGDITTDDPSSLAMLTHERQLEGADDDDDTQSFVLPATPTSRFPSSPATARTPLGELPVQLHTTPVTRTKVTKCPPVFSRPPSSPCFATPTASHPTLLVSSPPPVPQAHPSPDLPLAPPEIVVTSSVVDDSSSTLPVDTINNSRLLDTLSSQPLASTLRPHLQISTPNPNRCSVDLHASFQLHLQSEETSFDLLNDKISFFTAANAMDSFLNAMDEDDSFDMAIEEANLGKALERLKLEDKGEKAHSQLVNPAVTAKIKSPHAQRTNDPPNPSPSGVTARPSEQPSALTSESSNLGPAQNSPTTSSFRSAATAVPPSLAKPLATLPHEPVSAAPGLVHALSSTALSTPVTSLRNTLMVPKPGVPALRIVKRTARTNQEKLVLSDAPTGPTVASRAERSASGSSVAPAKQVSVPFSTGSGPSQGVPSRLLPVKTTGTGPRRVLVAETQSRVTQNTSGTRKARPDYPGRPHRVAVPLPVAPSKLPTTSGLRMPTQYKPSTASTLPRTGGVSRLAGPSAARVAGTGIQGIPARRVGYGI